jgi:hypothetical protein
MPRCQLVRLFLSLQVKMLTVSPDKIGRSFRKVGLRAEVADLSGRYFECA